MKVKEIVNALERFAPLPLQDGFDNAGLQIGLTEAEATGALLCLDVTEAVVEEAVTLGYNLIVSHHPLIFHGLKSITGSNYIERCVVQAIKNGITICSMHTNMDNVMGGVNFKIAEKLGLINIRFITPKEEGITPKAGAGIIGELPQKISTDKFLNIVKQTFNLAFLKHNRYTGKQVQTIALCGGSGAFLLPQAIMQQADVFLTGEIKYHDYFGHENYLLMIEIGHYESEQFTTEIFQQVIKK